jgi:glutamate 5-kinase
LLAAGVVDVQGDFLRGDVVRCVTAQGEAIAQGLINYASTEVNLLRGLSSDSFMAAIGYSAEPELMHADNLVLL